MFEYLLHLKEYIFFCRYLFYLLVLAFLLDSIYMVSFALAFWFFFNYFWPEREDPTVSDDRIDYTLCYVLGETGEGFVSFASDIEVTELVYNANWNDFEIILDYQGKQFFRKEFVF